MIRLQGPELKQPELKQPELKQPELKKPEHKELVVKKSLRALSLALVHAYAASVSNVAIRTFRFP